MEFRRFFIQMILTIITLPALSAWRDPTEPPLSVLNNLDSNGQSSDNSLRLTAIWISPTTKRANINGINAHVGETILSNVTILKINKNSVTIRHQGKIKTLHLIQLPFKQQTDSSR